MVTQAQIAKKPGISRQLVTLALAGYGGGSMLAPVTAAFFLPETKSRTLEEIEQYFEGKKPD